MRTHAELRTYVRGIYDHTFDDGPLVKVVVEGETLGMGVLDYGEQTCVLVMLDLCSELDLGTHRVLELNRDLGPASLVPVAGRYLLRQVMPLDAATAPFLRWTCSYLVTQARRLRAPILHQQGDEALYTHFTE